MDGVKGGRLDDRGAVPGVGISHVEVFAFGSGLAVFALKHALALAHASEGSKCRSRIPSQRAASRPVCTKRSRDTAGCSPSLIVTTEANELMSRLRPRMPCILHPRDYDGWLNRKGTEQLPLDLLRSLESGEMEMFEANPKVGTVRTMGRSCRCSPLPLACASCPDLARESNACIEPIPISPSSHQRRKRNSPASKLHYCSRAGENRSQSYWKPDQRRIRLLRVVEVLRVLLSEACRSTQPTQWGCRTASCTFSAGRPSSSTRPNAAVRLFAGSLGAGVALP